MDIFVGSIPFKMKENQLKALFEKFGEVMSVKIVIDKITRQNKGFGFVEMPDETQASKAIEELNGIEIDGRSILVSKSVKKEQQARSITTNKGSKEVGGKNSQKKPFKNEDKKSSNFRENRGKRKF